MCKKLTILHTNQSSIYGLRLEIQQFHHHKNVFVILITNAATVYRQGKGSYSVPQQCIKWIKFKQINGIGRVIVHNLHPLSYSEKMNQDVFAIIFADTLISCPIHVCFFNIKLLKQRFLLPARLHPVYYGSG